MHGAAACPTIFGIGGDQTPEAPGGSIHALRPDLQIHLFSGSDMLEPYAEKLFFHAKFIPAARKGGFFC